MRSARLKSNPPAAPMQTPLPEALGGGPKAVLLHWTPLFFRSSALPAITGRIFSNFMRKTLYSFSKNEYTSFVL